jgi:outer membrane protein assembly factor BamC
MMNPKILLIITGVTALPLLTACGYIKSLFPDKEKDYQYTTEIPALVLPADLAKQDGLKSIPRPALVLPEVTESPTTAAAAPAIKPLPEPSTPVTAPIEAPSVEPSFAETPQPESVTSEAQTTPIKRELIPVSIQKSAEGVDVLRMNAPLESAWRAVDKALSRKSIEVTERNKTERLFRLHFNPNEKVPENSSFWQETLFMFNGLIGSEQEFILKLTGSGEQTDVSVLDNGQKPSSDASATGLLNLLQDTIKSDFAK